MLLSYHAGGGVYKQEKMGYIMSREVSDVNEIIKSLYGRKSVRAYEDAPVPEEVKREVLCAAVQAPSAGCQQLYTILDITEQGLKDKLAETCDHQPFIAKAPVVLIFCADCRKWFDAFAEAGCRPRRPGAGDLLLAVSDANIAAQNAVVAAESLGLGSCYIGDIMERYEEHRGLLKLPDWVFPACMLVMGYPTAQQRARKKPERVEMKHIVHENGYRRMDGEELREMFAGRTDGKGFDAWMDAFCKRKYNSGFAREMTRSVEEYLREFENEEPV